MNCEEMTNLLHGYLDHELDLVRTLEAEQHLKECPACSRQYEEQQVLRKVIAGGSLYFDAPNGLERRVRMAVRQANQAGTPSRRWNWELSRFWVRWLLPTGAVAAVLLLLAVPWLARPSAEHLMAREIVSAHVRSLMANHLTDVASTDQHTVKPWFNGRLSFSPPVADLAAQGFPLVGGRLDVLEEQSVAALVYQRHKHFINLFIWPSTRNKSLDEKVLVQRGYNLIHWAAGGMDCWAASDVNQGELQEFVRLLREQTIKTGIR